MSRQTIRARIERLAESIPQQGDGTGCAVFMRDMETFEDACRRLGIKSGRLIAVREVLPPDQWARLARFQQGQLMRGEI